MVRCKRCNKLLTNPKSVERRYGPVCWRKIGQPFRTKTSHNIMREGLVLLEDFFGVKQDE